MLVECLTESLYICMLNMSPFLSNDKPIVTKIRNNSSYNS